MPLSRLNPEQYKAATASYGHNLIIASAGTGKTSTIVGRIAHLLGQGVKPEEILLLTFTNKAAQEMVERIATFFGKQIASKIDAGTFHAVSYRWIKRFEGKVVLKQPRELKTLFRSVYEKRSFHHLEGDSAPYGANYLYDLYSFYQNTEMQRSFEAWIAERQSEHDIYAMIYADVIDEFEALKKQYGFLNFNDLLIHMRTICAEKQLGYKEVLVDEYRTPMHCRERSLMRCSRRHSFVSGIMIKVFMLLTEPISQSSALLIKNSRTLLYTPFQKITVLPFRFFLWQIR